MTFEFHAYCYYCQFYEFGTLGSCGHLTVPKLAKAKFKRNKLKYLGPKPSANMNMKQPAIETAGG